MRVCHVVRPAVILAAVVSAVTACPRARAATLLVCSHNTHSVLRYDGTTGSFLDAFVPSDSGGQGPTHGLIFGPDGNLYVGDVAADAVRRFDGKTGAFLDLFVAPHSGG